MNNGTGIIDSVVSRNIPVRKQRVTYCCWHGEQADTTGWFQRACFERCSTIGRAVSHGPRIARSRVGESTFVLALRKLHGHLNGL